VKRLIVGFILVVLALSWIGCQNSQTAQPAAGESASAPKPASERVPTEQDGAKVWRNQTKNNHLEQNAELVAFKKTDGALNGNTYTLYGETTVRALKGMPGQIMKTKISYVFTKTEQGWRGPDGEVY